MKDGMGDGVCGSRRVFDEEEFKIYNDVFG